MIYKNYIEEKYLEQLENMLYFNPHQIRYLQEIDSSIKSFGIPRIIKDEKGYIISIENIIDLQNLFVFQDNGDKLIGVLLYFFEEKKIATLLHIAIPDPYNTINNPNQILLIKIIFDLKKILKKIKGIEFLKILYSDNTNLIKIR